MTAAGRGPRINAVAVSAARRTGEGTHHTEHDARDSATRIHEGPERENTLGLLEDEFSNPSAVDLASPGKELTMKHNVARRDRAVRAVAGCGMLVCSVFAPLPPLVRLLALGGGGVYLVATAVFGSCLGYRMLGISTCRADRTRT